MALLEIAGLRPCTCSDHAFVRLQAAEDGAPLDIKVEIATAHAILAELNGIASPSATLVDLFSGTLRALALEIAGLTLHGIGSERPVARLELGNCSPPRVLQVPAGIGLLVACRVGCPVRRDDAPLQPHATPEPPELFREFLATLDLDGLGGEEN